MTLITKNKLTKLSVALALLSPLIAMSASYEFRLPTGSTALVEAEPEPITGASCNEFLEQDSSLEDGIYTLDNGLDVYCDMTTDGGGWTLIVKAQQSNNSHANASGVGSLTSPYQGTVAKLSDADINQIPKTAYRVSNAARSASVFFDTSDSFASTRQVNNKASKTINPPSWQGPFYAAEHRGFNTYEQNSGHFGESSWQGAVYTGHSSSDNCRLGISVTSAAAGWCGAGDASTVWLK